MTFSIKFGLPLSTKFPPYFPNHKERSSNVTLPSQVIHKSTGVVTAQLPFLAHAETSDKSQIQSVIDLLRDFADKGYAKQVQALHGLVLKSNFSDQDLVVLLNHVAHMYSKCSDFDSARRVFDKMSQRNIFSWTVMIAGSTENGFYLDGFDYFVQMLNHGILPDKFAYSAVLQTCIGLDCVELGQMVHSQIVIRGFTSQTFVATSLLNMYSKLGRSSDSYKVFNTMAEHNEVSWNAMISGFTMNGLHLEAYNHFVRMKNEGVKPNVYTLISVSKAVGQLSDVYKVREVQDVVSELGMESNVLLGTALIDMYSKCGLLDDAWSVFDANFFCCRLNTPWNAMISGYSQHRYAKEAVELYKRMCQKDIKPDIYTYCSVFNAVAALKCLHFVKEVHGMIVKNGQIMTVISVCNAIADAYAKCGSLKDVKQLFDRMEERDMISWTTLVTAYSQCGEWDEALAIFSLMREDGFQPNQFTFSSVLVSCASLCFLEYGQQVHGLIFKAGFESDKCIESALLDMYAKCGCIIEAERVFDKCDDPDTISWTAIISGCAQNGMIKDALQLFTKMELQGLKPNAVTLLCVLFACSHGGMVDEGLYYFQLMEEKYGLVPQMEHFACIVDLLGRVGRLDEALEFIRKMRIEPNEMVWQALLAACRVHGNLEMAEIAAQKILSINPEYSSTYVLLSNTYKETGSFEDGLIFWDVMKERGVRKEPGYSWIYVKGKLHKFYSGDQRHPQNDDIYLKLEELRDNVKSMDYVPYFCLET